MGAALTMAGGDPRLALALQEAFMDAFSAACLVVGVICLVGAAGAAIWLPGREVQVRPTGHLDGDDAGDAEVAGSSRCSSARLPRMTQRTLVLLKPDAVRRGLVGNVLSRFEAKGLTIVAMEQRHIDGEQADRHYAEHVERDFYPPLRTFVTSGPLVALVLEGDEAIEVVRALNGATDGRKAPPGTIRGDLSLSNRENLVHGSDSPESADARDRALVPLPLSTQV